jgi:alkanesulfonate monooxygenase SsuD/methylene tetrahydromethanopterin reductase-like flavin-dependent oxidoreductase (luciferase family)
VKGARIRPKPIQQPHPVVMCAGVSGRGRHFSAKYADVSFVNLDTYQLDGLRARVDSVRRLAREEYGREVQVWTNSYIFQADTEAEARRFYNYTVFERGDWPGVENLTHMLGINSQSIPPNVLKTLKEHFIAGWAGYPLVGTPDQVVDGLRVIEAAGFDGTLLSWPRYLQDMQEFQVTTLPLLKQAGLR